MTGGTATRRGAAVLAAVTLLLGGCGAAEEDTASKAISDSITKAQDSGGVTLFDVTRTEADCIGDGWVDRIGTDRLKEYRLLTEDLRAERTLTEVDPMSASDARAATDVLFACADVPSMVNKGVAGSGRVPQRVQDCLRTALTEDVLRPLLEASFRGGAAEAEKLLAEPLSTCALG